SSGRTPVSLPRPSTIGRSPIGHARVIGCGDAPENTSTRPGRAVWAARPGRAVSAAGGPGSTDIGGLRRSARGGSTGAVVRRNGGKGGGPAPDRLPGGDFVGGIQTEGSITRSDAQTADDQRSNTASLPPTEFGSGTSPRWWWKYSPAHQPAAA